MTQASVMKREAFQRFRFPERSQSQDNGRVRGVAFPLEVPDDRPGIAFMDDGSISFFEYSQYRASAFDKQLADSDLGGRVRFMWQHGGVGPYGDVAQDAHEGVIPIGTITSMTKTPAGVLYEAEFGDTRMAQELRQAVLSGAVEEVSTLVETLAYELNTDAEGRTFRDVTEARFWDVSLVVRAQFPQTRVLEASCHQCGSVVPPHDEIDEEPPEAISASMATNGTSNGHVTLTREQYGKLLARINDLQHVLESNGLCEACLMLRGEPCENHVRL